MTAPSAAAGAAAPIGALFLATFASSVTLRMTDTLLPEIARDFAVTPGTASLAVTVYAVSYGLVQFVAGPLADRFGKLTGIAFCCVAATLTAALCALATDFSSLLLARGLAGVAAGGVIPLGLAYVGDAVPVEQRQATLARFMLGQMLGYIAGQVSGGAVGEHLGWRAAMWISAGLFALGAAVLVAMAPQVLRGGGGGSATAAPPLRVLLRRPAVIVVLALVIPEGILMYGTYALIATDLHLRAGLSLTVAGLVMAMLGVGGLVYAVTVRRLLDRIGRAGLPVLGAMCHVAGLSILIVAPGLVTGMAAMFLLGIGFYTVHTTLQAEATQMIPEARGLALSLFAGCFFAGQAIGVAWAGWTFDRFGAPPVFATSVVFLPVVAWQIRRMVSVAPR